MIDDFIGKIFTTNNYGDLIVIEKVKKPNDNYKYYYKCKFLQYPCEVIARKYDIKSKQVANPLFPSVYNKGYLGIGKYNKSLYKEIYYIWHGMLSRCYSLIDKRYKVTGALGITVCEEWLNFQNFAAWYEENSKWNVNNYILNLDKDILCNIQHLETKIYSPETCLLIPEEINMYLLGDNWKAGIKIRKNLILSTSKKYESRVYLNNKRLDKHFNYFKESKCFYSQNKFLEWKRILFLIDLPIQLKEILLKYDFSWSWIWENMTEEEILKNY